MQVEISEITPQVARALLGRNHSNRPVNPHHVSRMAADMQRGKWHFNGDAIRISDGGTLMDGQHRLMACINSNVPFTTVLVSGLSDEVARTIDGGRKRTISDKFTMSGVKNAKAMATAIRIIGRVAANSKSYQPTDQEFFELLSLHPGLSESVSRFKNMPFRLSAIVAAFHYIAAQTSGRKLADDFGETIRTGIPTRGNDPAHTFREWVIRNSAGVHKLPFDLILLGACRAWSSYSDGKPLQKIVPGEKLEVKGWDRKALFSQC